MEYRIEHRIRTIAQNAVMPGGQPPAFTTDGVELTHWSFNFRDGWLGDAWLASGMVEAVSYVDAFVRFRAKLDRIIPRIALISQCFIDYLREPFLIHRTDSDVAFFRWSGERKGVGLMFMEKEQQALEELLNAPSVPHEFFLYWNDAVNTTGYSSKLLLMFSALEALVKRKNGTKDWALLGQILEPQLVEELWGKKGDSHQALRHRLVHGEYFGGTDAGKDYVGRVHKRVIRWFNQTILVACKIEEGVLQPQRHPFGNMEETKSFVRALLSPSDLSLRSLVDDHGEHGLKSRDRYEYVHEPAVTQTY